MVGLSIILQSGRRRLSITLALAGLVGLISIVVSLFRSGVDFFRYTALVATFFFVGMNTVFAAVRRPQAWMAQLQSFFLLLVGAVSNILSVPGNYGGILLCAIAIVLLARNGAFSSNRQVVIFGVFTAVITLAIAAVVRRSSLQDILGTGAIAAGVFSIVFFAFYSDLRMLEKENDSLRLICTSRNTLLMKLNDDLEKTVRERNTISNRSRELAQRAGILENQIKALEAHRIDLSVFELSPREVEVLKDLVSTCSRNKDIGLRLGITERTVKSHVYRICNKVGVDSRLELIDLFRQNFSPNEDAATDAQPDNGFA